jgi:hypothetical protein
MNEPGKAPVCYECVWQTNRRACIQKMDKVSGDGQACDLLTPIEEPPAPRKGHRHECMDRD